MKPASQDQSHIWQISHKVTPIHTARVSSPSFPMRVISDTAGYQHTERCVHSHLDTHRPSQASVLEETPRGTQTSSRFYITSFKGKCGSCCAVGDLENIASNPLFGKLKGLLLKDRTKGSIKWQCLPERGNPCIQTWNPPSFPSLCPALLPWHTPINSVSLCVTSHV